MASEKELNDSLSFEGLTLDQRESFRIGKIPQRVHLERNFQIYKWTSYPLFDKDNQVSEYWSPWAAMELGQVRVPGFVDLRKRYANRPGEVGRPQEFMRARSAVTMEWNQMDSITKAQLIVPVWGFLGICAHKAVSTSPKAANVFFIAGNYQLVIPNLTSEHVLKL